MKIRTFSIITMGILLAAGTSWAQVQASSSNARSVSRDLGQLLADEQAVTQIITVQYYPLEDLRDLISNVFRIDRAVIHIDERSNRLIIRTEKEKLQDLLNLIKQLDVPDVVSAETTAMQTLVYRVYMFEIPVTSQDLKPFFMNLQTSSQITSGGFLDAVTDRDLQISGFQVINDDEEKRTIVMQGKAASGESLKRIVEKIPQSQIMELKWDDEETFTKDIEAARYSRLPEPLRKHIQTFLGESIRTVGYWFGAVSLPGETNAPIGPWRLEMRTETERRSNPRENTLRLDIKVLQQGMSPYMSPYMREKEIISNSIEGRIGKPIIVGYNRESYGTRKMGAMVILPEAETAPSNDSGATTLY